MNRAARRILLGLAGWLVCNPAPGHAQADDGEGIEVGGAVRYNLFLTDYEGAGDPNRLQFTWDMWRINVRGSTGGVGIRFEYRFYPTFNTHFVKEGWFALDLSEESDLQVGVTQVPFGNLQYNSHNWWFQLPYYVGLEDDHDMGVKLLHRRGDWSVMGAYFVQPEPAGPAGGEASFGIGGAGRYSYDLIPVEGAANQERHQGNLRVTRDFRGGGGRVETGASLLGGRIWNGTTEDWGSRWALALHADAYRGPWNARLQLTRYEFSATDDDGESLDAVTVGAYGDPYDVAARATLVSVGLARDVELEWGPFTGMQIYDNYTWMGKDAAGFHDTHQHVLGASLAAGPLFVYLDAATGRNHPWLTDDFGVGLAEGRPDARWNTRFNVNLGFYF